MNIRRTRLNLVESRWTRESLFIVNEGTFRNLVGSAAQGFANILGGRPPVTRARGRGYGQQAPQHAPQAPQAAQAAPKPSTDPYDVAKRREAALSFWKRGAIGRSWFGSGTQDQTDIATQRVADLKYQGDRRKQKLDLKAEKLRSRLALQKSRGGAIDAGADAVRRSTDVNVTSGGGIMASGDRKPDTKVIPSPEITAEVTPASGGEAPEVSNTKVVPSATPSGSSLTPSSGFGSKEHAKALADTIGQHAKVTSIPGTPNKENQAMVLAYNRQMLPLGHEHLPTTAEMASLERSRKRGWNAPTKGVVLDPSGKSGRKQSMNTTKAIKALRTLRSNPPKDSSSPGTVGSPDPSGAEN